MILLLLDGKNTPFVSGDGSVKLPARASNAHYHLQMDCFKLADPKFNPLSLVIPEEVKITLSFEFKEYLRINFGCELFYKTDKLYNVLLICFVEHTIRLWQHFHKFKFCRLPSLSFCLALSVFFKPR